MSRDPRTVPLFTQVDISAAPASSSAITPAPESGESTGLLRDMLAALDRQNELLEGMLNHMLSQQRQREIELRKWRNHYPQLARRCRSAADVLGKVHAEFLDSITREIDENAEDLQDGEFTLAEFVDRFGPRLAHLTGLLHILSQLGRGAAVPDDEQ